MDWGARSRVWNVANGERVDQVSDTQDFAYHVVFFLVQILECGPLGLKRSGSNV